MLKPILFRLEAEKSHDLTISVLAAVSKSQVACSLLNFMYGSTTQHTPREVMGIQFPNQVGLAAGLDKHAKACNALHALGFGWIEIGTVTPRPQPGNLTPRLFRLNDYQAIINRMGFNSIGLEPFVKNLQSIKTGIIKGINIGKNTSTPIDRAIDDYLTGLYAVTPYADYVAINISSPNTKRLRDLQHPNMLGKLLASIDNERNRLADQSGSRTPLVLKIAPDLDRSQIDGIARLLRRHCIDGVIATNTTLDRPGIIHANEVGGISGPPVHRKSVEVIDALYQNLEGEIPIIGVGGIDSGAAAIETIQAGAELIQIYTGLIYHGPQLVSDIVNMVCQHNELNSV